MLHLQEDDEHWEELCRETENTIVLPRSAEMQWGESLEAPEVLLIAQGSEVVVAGVVEGVTRTAESVTIVLRQASMVCPAFPYDKPDSRYTTIKAGKPSDVMHHGSNFPLKEGSTRGPVAPMQGNLRGFEVLPG